VNYDTGKEEVFKMVIIKKTGTEMENMSKILNIIDTHTDITCPSSFV